MFWMIYSIYPPFIGETACSEKIFSAPFVYFAGFGYQRLFLSARIRSISSGETSWPFTPTMDSSLRFENDILSILCNNIQ